jgi:hypothetical protein
VTVVLGGGLIASEVQAQTVAYANDFDGHETLGAGVTGGFQESTDIPAGNFHVESVRGLGTLPERDPANPWNAFSGNFLRNGQAGNPQTIPDILILDNLPAHSTISLSFLLGLIDSWDGDREPTAPNLGDANAGTDQWMMILYDSSAGSTVIDLGADPLLDAPAGFYGGSFRHEGPSNGTISARRLQELFGANNDVLISTGNGAYSGWRSKSVSGENASKIFTAYANGNDPRLQNIAHTGSSLRIDFFAGGANWQVGTPGGNENESWGLDNIVVTLDGSALTPPDNTANAPADHTPALACNTSIAMIVGDSTGLNAGDQAVVDLLATMSFGGVAPCVVCYDDDNFDEAQLSANHDLILVSATADGDKVGGSLRCNCTPLVFWNPDLHRHNREGMSGIGATTANYVAPIIYSAFDEFQTDLFVLDNSHPVTASLALDANTVYNTPQLISWGGNGDYAFRPNTAADDVSVLSEANVIGHGTIIVADEGDRRSVNQPSTFLRRSVFLWLGENTAQNLNATGQQVVKDAVTWSVGGTPTCLADAGIEVTIDKDTICPGETRQLVVNRLTTPASDCATDVTAGSTFISLTPALCSVDANGVVTGLAGGGGTAMVQATNGADMDDVSFTVPALCSSTLVNAFQFSSHRSRFDKVDCPVYNDPTQTYTEVLKTEGQNGSDQLSYDQNPGRGWGYIEQNAPTAGRGTHGVFGPMDQKQDNELSFHWVPWALDACGDDLYNGHVSVSGTQDAGVDNDEILFRVDVANGNYRFVGAFGAQRIPSSVRILAEDGSTGTMVTLVNGISLAQGEFAQVGFDGKIPPPGDGIAPEPDNSMDATIVDDPTFFPMDSSGMSAATADSPTLAVTSGYIRIHQMTETPGSGTGGSMALLEVWSVDSIPELLHIWGQGANPNSNEFVFPQSAAASITCIPVSFNTAVTISNVCITSTGTPAATTATLGPDPARPGLGNYCLNLDAALEQQQWTTITLDATGAGGMSNICLQVAHLPADVNQDGNVGLADASAFVTEFNGAKRPCLVDSNNDGQVGLADVSDWVNNFNGNAGIGIPQGNGTFLPIKPACACP